MLAGTSHALKELAQDCIALLLLAAIGIGTYLVLMHVVVPLRLALLPPALVTRSYSHYFWNVIALFWALGVALASTSRSLELKWPGFARGMSIYLVRDGKYRSESDLRFYRGFGIAIVAVTLTFAFLGLNCNLQLQNQAIVVHPLFSLSDDVHRYGDIAGIRTAPVFQAPNGQWRIGRNYDVLFKDHSHLRLPYSVWTNPNDPVEDEIAELLSRKSGVPIVEDRSIPPSALRDAY